MNKTHRKGNYEKREIYLKQFYLSSLQFNKISKPVVNLKFIFMSD